MTKKKIALGVPQPRHADGTGVHAVRADLALARRSPFERRMFALKACQLARSLFRRPSSALFPTSIKPQSSERAPKT